MSADKTGYVYLMYSESTDWVKIGHSVDPAKRLNQVNAEVPGLSWKLGCQMYCEDRYAVEKAWHAVFDKERIVRNKEWFILRPEQVRLFKTVCEQVRAAPRDDAFPFADASDVARDPREVIEMARSRFAVGTQKTIRGDLADWSAVMQDLKRNRQALTAAVYEEARVKTYDGKTLELTFPEFQSFYIGMANERKHAAELRNALERKHGERPKIVVGVEGGGS